MATVAGQGGAWRRALLALLMAAVLGAATGMGWLLEVRADRRVRAGADILRQIRADRLTEYWSDEPRIDWYLIRVGSAVRGWRAAARSHGSDGAFSGLTVDLTRDESKRSEQLLLASWSLNADATAGRYVGTVEVSGAGSSETRIFLSDGRLNVQQLTLDLEAESPAPDNYLPEGSMGLAVRLVAGSGADAQFAMVFDEKPNSRGVVEFGSIRIRSLGSARAEDGSLIRRARAWGFRGHGEYSVTYELSADGRLLSVIHDDGLRWAAASQEEVARHFPNAARLVEGLLRSRRPQAAPDPWGKLFLDVL